MWDAILARLEKQASASVMARLTLERAMPAAWVDEVFENHRQRRYPRELLFSTVVESLAALYDKVKRTEPALLRALVWGSAQRLEPIVSALGAVPACPAGKCASSTATICLPRRNASRRCATSTPPLCRGIRWWCP